MRFTASQQRPLRSLRFPPHPHQRVNEVVDRLAFPGHDGSLDAEGRNGEVQIWCVCRVI